MLSVLVEWEYQCYLFWLNGNTNVIFFDCMGIPMLSFLTVWEYQCYIFGCTGMGIPMLLFLVDREYQSYLCWLNANTNVIFCGCMGIPMLSF
jgi:hypothetical protein